MTQDNTDTIAAIKSAMDELLSAFNELKRQILNKDNALKGAILCPETGEATEGDARENLIKALGDWNIHPTANSGEVVRFPGCYAASADIVAAVHHFNEAKENLTSTTKSLIASGTAERALRHAYSNAGYPTIHPLQARRLVRVVDGENLKRISFSIAKRVESIEKITAKQAWKRLESNEAFEIIKQIANLAPNETVRWHKPVGAHIRANVVHQEEGGKRISRMLHSSLPIIIDGDTLPKIVFNHPSQGRKKRSDTLSNNRIELPFIRNGYLSF
jgi:hypothetical protein